MAADPKHFYEFGPFRIDVSERTLSRDGQIVAITPKAFDLLLMLVRKSGQTIDKETLMKEVWPDSFVEEGNLPVNMTALRRALNESADEHTYIETVPRRGYRFVAPVTENWVHNGRPQNRKPWPGVKALVNLRLVRAETSVAPAPALPVRSRELLAWALAAAGIGAAVVLVVYYRDRPAPRPTVVLPPTSLPSIRATIPAPGNAQSGFGNAVISPDGLRLAISMESHGTRSLWLRALTAPSAQPLAGTEGANCLFWSPDSRFIGFFADNKLKTIEVSSGAIQTLCDARGGRGGTWSREGVIVYAQDYRMPLKRVSESGGDPVVLRLDNWGKEQGYYRYPCFLPDGHHFIYRAGATPASTKYDKNGIYVCSLESDESKLILRDDTYAAYASGHLLFWRDGALMAQPLDEKNLELTGDAVRIAERVEFDPLNVEADFSVSENGVLVFVTGAPTLGQLVWFDRDGKQVEKLGEPGRVSNPRISPDGKRVAAQIVNPEVGTSEIWVYDLARNARTRLTSNVESDTNPVWSPDGRRIVFSSNRKDYRKFDIYQKDASGLVNEEVLFESDDSEAPQSWSSDGRFVAYAKNPPSVSSLTEIWVLPLIGEGKPFPFLQAERFSHRWPQFSPDGRFIAYVSYESVKDQVCVTSFPERGFKQQVSTDGGWLPRWRGDGKELFFLVGGASHHYPVALAGKMMAAEVKSNGSSLDIGNARPLFDAHPWFDANLSSIQTGFWQGTVYDVTPDGQRFLIIIPGEATPASINLVVNWTADLKR
jgi:DNA-binding winged helix-turn-helix (wHTH) protein/Tol biopolymer transport system component